MKRLYGKAISSGIITIQRRKFKALILKSRREIMPRKQGWEWHARDGRKKRGPHRKVRDPLFLPLGGI
jgi:hypothetical protein